MGRGRSLLTSSRRVGYLRGFIMTTNPWCKRVERERIYLCSVNFLSKGKHARELGCYDNVVQYCRPLCQDPDPAVAVSWHCTRCSGERNKQGREEAGTVPSKSPTHYTLQYYALSLSHAQSRSHWTPTPPRACPDKSAPALDT